MFTHQMIRVNHITKHIIRIVDIPQNRGFCGKAKKTLLLPDVQETVTQSHIYTIFFGERKVHTDIIYRVYALNRLYTYIWM